MCPEWKKSKNQQLVGVGGGGWQLFGTWEYVHKKSFFFTILMGTKKNFYPQKTNTRKPCLHTIINWTKNDHELIVYNIII